MLVCIIHEKRQGYSLCLFCYSAFTVLNYDASRRLHLNCNKTVTIMLQYFAHILGCYIFVTLLLQNCTPYI